jgi:hypothetical protein
MVGDINHTQENKTTNYWEQELKKNSLKEPPMKARFLWLKPLTIFHGLEFRGYL